MLIRNNNKINIPNKKLELECRMVIVVSVFGNHDKKPFTVTLIDT